MHQALPVLQATCVEWARYIRLLARQPKKEAWDRYGKLLLNINDGPNSHVWMDALTIATEIVEWTADCDAFDKFDDFMAEYWEEQVQCARYLIIKTTAACICSLLF